MRPHAGARQARAAAVARQRVSRLPAARLQRDAPRGRLHARPPRGAGLLQGRARPPGAHTHCTRIASRAQLLSGDAHYVCSRACCAGCCAPASSARTSMRMPVPKPAASEQRSCTLLARRRRACRPARCTAPTHGRTASCPRLAPRCERMSALRRAWETRCCAASRAAWACLTAFSAAAWQAGTRATGCCGELLPRAAVAHA